MHLNLSSPPSKKMCIGQKNVRFSMLRQISKNCVKTDTLAWSWIGICLFLTSKSDFLHSRFPKIFALQSNLRRQIRNRSIPLEAYTRKQNDSVFVFIENYVTKFILKGMRCIWLRWIDLCEEIKNICANATCYWWGKRRSESILWGYLWTAGWSDIHEFFFSYEVQ